MTLQQLAKQQVATQQVVMQQVRQAAPALPPDGMLGSAVRLQFPRYNVDYRHMDDYLSSNYAQANFLDAIYDDTDNPEVPEQHALVDWAPRDAPLMVTPRTFPLSAAPGALPSILAPTMEEQQQTHTPNQVKE